MIRNGPDIIMPLDIRQKSYTEFDIRPGIEFDSLLDAELDILPDIEFDTRVLDDMYHPHIRSNIEFNIRPDIALSIEFEMRSRIIPTDSIPGCLAHYNNLNKI